MARKAEDEHRADGVTPELDELSSTLMGDAFDLLAAGKDVDVLLVVGDAAGNVASYAFSDDGMEEWLAGAHAKVRELRRDGGDPEVGLGSPCAMQ